ncbi:mannosyltransferase [Ephemerocybe angulata]|uniref:Chitobiosyldiphosphodolichol beta-mannosyltransferase n=1 Tax=Ephemerocybe angulata TaxID=980116 RepID=A0A8H6MEH3_9AGAR|nr:mannosyltransferase [Tulosesus angulatus]
MITKDVLDFLPVIILTGILVAVTAFMGYVFKPRNHHSLRSVAILVLGDIGRSPRMMYHAQSFAENGFVTDVVGYGGSDLTPALERLPRVKARYLSEPPTILRYLPFVIAAPIKIIHQIVSILLVLLVDIEKPPEFIVVQNPPSIPSLALVQLVGRIRGSKVIIDWHNLGYSILALKLGEKHLFVRIYKWFEATFGYSAYAHLFVTRAMRDHLVKEWDLQGHKVVLHDRPPQHFHLTTSNLQDPRAVIAHSAPNPTALPNYSEIRSPTHRPDRPAILVSSTSWTPDEDFSILLQALAIYELRAQELSRPGSEGTLPKLLAIVTGKGPLKQKYMEEVNEMQKSWDWVRCISLWLEAEDYPVLLGGADLGVSLHSSSSGLDLPMKIVDMFGCGLPVCALNFKCLDELVKHGKNGVIFHDAGELAEQLEVRLSPFI